MAGRDYFKMLRERGWDQTYELRVKGNVDRSYVYHNREQFVRLLRKKLRQGFGLAQVEHSWCRNHCYYDMYVVLEPVMDGPVNFLNDNDSNLGYQACRFYEDRIILVYQGYVWARYLDDGH